MEANMDGNKEENFSLHFAVPPYGPSWCRRAELAARKRRIGPGPGGEGGRFPTPRRSSFCAPRFPNKIFSLFVLLFVFQLFFSSLTSGDRDGGRNSAV